MVTSLASVRSYIALAKREQGIIVHAHPNGHLTYLAHHSQASIIDRYIVNGFQATFPMNYVKSTDQVYFRVLDGNGVYDSSSTYTVGIPPSPTVVRT